MLTELFWAGGIRRSELGVYALCAPGVAAGPQYHAQACATVREGYLRDDAVATKRARSVKRSYFLLEDDDVTALRRRLGGSGKQAWMTAHLCESVF